MNRYPGESLGTWQMLNGVTAVMDITVAWEGDWRQCLALVGGALWIPENGGK